MSSSLPRLTGFLVVGLAAVSPGWAGSKSVELIRAHTTPSEANLLDVAVLMFDANLPEDPADIRKLAAEGIFPEAREAESRYLPVVLKRTLQTAGFWGRVRTVPDAAISDLTVSGVLLSSSGAELKLEVRIVDSRGTIWLNKRYSMKADASAYLARETKEDPFQGIHNRIANDTLAEYRKLAPEKILRIRATSRLRFAADLAPEAFASYLETKKTGRYSIARLPARDDPIMVRVDRIRDRDQVFIDIVDNYYDCFHAQMNEAYDSWRAHDYWRRQAMKDSRPGSMGRSERGRSWSPRSLDGGGPWNGGGSVCGTPQMTGGSSQPGLELWGARDANVDVRALRELGASLAADVAPLVVEVDGKILRLTGSLESQYAAWRKLLREIYATETGLPSVSAVESGTSPN